LQADSSSSVELLLTQRQPSKIEGEKPISIDIDERRSIAQKSEQDEEFQRFMQSMWGEREAVLRQVVFA